MGSRKISKTKFLKTKVQKVFEELDKAEFSGLALNQIMITIRSFILNRLFFIFAKMDIPKKFLEQIDMKVRDVINRFIKRQCLQKSFIYPNVKTVEWESSV
jgi:hypothetical protein